MIQFSVVPEKVEIWLTNSHWNYRAMVTYNGKQMVDGVFLIFLKQWTWFVENLQSAINRAVYKFL